jgi:MFS family permease
MKIVKRGSCSNIKWTNSGRRKIIMFIRKIKSYPPMLWLLSIGVVINLTGMSFLWPMTTIYVHDVLGMSLPMAGIVLLLQQAGAMLGNLAGGVLFDRWGGRKTIILGITLSILTVTSMGIWQDFYIYVALMTLLGVCYGTIFPAMNALVGAIWPEGGRKAINFIYVAQNLGVALGSALGGFLAAVSFKWVFFGNAVTYAVFLVLFISLFRVHRLQKEPEFPADRRGSSAVVPMSVSPGLRVWIPLGLLSIGFMISWISYVQWQSTISVHLQTLGITLYAYSLLWTINGTMIVLGQPLSAWFIDKFAQTLKTQIVSGAVIYALALTVVIFSESYVGFVIAMLIMTFGEMLIWPGVPSLAAEMATKGREGWYQGIVSSAATAGRMVGPLLGGLLFERLSPDWMFSVMIGLCLFAAMCFIIYDKVYKVKAVSLAQAEGTITG